MSQLLVEIVTSLWTAGAPLTPDQPPIALGGTGADFVQREFKPGDVFTVASPVAAADDATVIVPELWVEIGTKDEATAEYNPAQGAGRKSRAFPVGPASFGKPIGRITVNSGNFVAVRMQSNTVDNLRYVQIWKIGTVPTIESLGKSAWAYLTRR